MKTFFLAIASIALVTSRAQAADDLAQRSAELQQLLGDIQKALPEGWHAAATPDVPEKVACEFRQPDASGIMIWRQDKAVGKYVGLNLPPGSTDAEEQPQRLFIQMMLAARLTPAEFDAAAKRNAEHEHARREFQRSLDAAGIKNSLVFRVIDSEEELPPATFKPQTPEQKELLRRYALLWAETDLQPLPTHYDKSIAFNIDFDPHFSLQDDQVEAERREVRQAILKLVTPYGHDAAAKEVP